MITSDTNFRGNFDSIEAVWEAIPYGGVEGDYLNIQGVKYRWNKYLAMWENAEVVTETPARETVTFDEDVNMQNNLTVAGVLRAKKFVVDDLPTGIEEVEITESAVSGGNNVITFTYTNGESQTFNVKNGEAGKTMGAFVIVADATDKSGWDTAKGYLVLTETEGEFDVYSYENSTWSKIDTIEIDLNYDIKQTTGQSTTSVMSQKAVTDEIEIRPTILNIVGKDFAIVDEQGYGIVLFEDGHLRTKNFNSKNAVVNSLPYLSQTKKYTKQVDDDFVFENVGLIGNWVKRTFNNVSVASSYSWGAEILFAVRGTTSVVANFIIDSSVAAPSISYNVDDGEWTTTTASASVTLVDNISIPTSIHTIRIRVASCTLNENIYTQGAGALNFAGLSVDANANVMPLSVTNKKCLFIGDSITGGVGSSVWQGYSYVLSDMLNMQTIQCALAGGGLVHGSRTYLPTAAQVLGEMISGAYNAVNTPDIIFINLGTNDGRQTPSETFVLGYHNLIAYIRRRFGGCHIYACAPFNRVHKSDVESATEGFDNITYIDTTALVGTYTTSDGTHPDVAGAKTCAEFCYDKIIETINLNYFN